MADSFAAVLLSLFCATLAQISQTRYCDVDAACLEACKVETQKDNLGDYRATALGDWTQFLSLVYVMGGIMPADDVEDRTAPGLCTDALAVECQARISKEDWTVARDRGQNVTCSVDKGLRCVQRPMLCVDYSVRWFCPATKGSVTLASLKTSAPFALVAKQASPAACQSLNCEAKCRRDACKQVQDCRDGQRCADAVAGAPCGLMRNDSFHCLNLDGFAQRCKAASDGTTLGPVVGCAAGSVRCDGTPPPPTTAPVMPADGTTAAAQRSTTPGPTLLLLLLLLLLPLLLPVIACA